MYALSLVPSHPPLTLDSVLCRPHSGRVTIPTSAFFSVLGGQEGKRKGGTQKS